MSNYQTTEVYSYLSYLEHYLKGDLDTFHKICKEAEKNENILTPAVTASHAGNANSEVQETSSTTTTTQTTMYPDSASSHYFGLTEGKPDIFRLTIPITLTLFATIDCLGYLSGSNNDPLKTNENFKEFFKQSSITVTQADAVFLNQVFRQGLTHVYFPKLSLGISYHSKNPSGKLFFKDGNAKLILNVSRLEEIVISTFEGIKQSEGLYGQMESRYQFLKSDYQTKHGGIIANYLLNI